MKVLDLFCGAGGFGYGFKKVGFTVEGIDVNENCAKTYSKNVGRCIKADIRTLDTRDFDADVVIGSPPCKSFSFANRRTNNPKNPLNDLIWEFLRFVQGISPDAFVLENVVGLRVGWRKKLVQRLKKELEKTGFSVAEVVLDAFEFEVPQRRKRLFLIGMKHPFFFSPQRRRGGTVRDAIGDLPVKKEIPEINHIWTHSKRGTIKKMKYIRQGHNWTDLPPNLAPKNKLSKHNKVWFRLKWNEPSCTVCHPRKSVYIHPEVNRIISVREAARLQSFPDSFIFYGNLDSQYQQVADAVPPLLAEAIAKEVLRQRKLTEYA